MKKALLSRLSRIRYDLAFIQEDIDEVINNKPIHFIRIRNPYYRECWFADPFILDVTESYVFILAEAVWYSTGKGRIAKLTVDKERMEICKVEIILEEPWHLSFPFIIRDKGKIYVCPESANSGKLFMYELMESHGSTRLSRVATVCNDVIWDSIITNVRGEQRMLTCRSNDFALDIYKMDEERKVFIYDYSLTSTKQNMRMAGDVFHYKDIDYLPTQISDKIHYGKAVEIKQINDNNGRIGLSSLRKIKPPHGLLIEGLHTFNFYKGVIVVDILRHNNIAGLFINWMVIFKKWLVK